MTFSDSIVRRTFDYIIVGAGVAGCALASRLSADQRINVLLIEAGPDHRPGQEDAALLDRFPVSLGCSRFSWPGLTAEVGAERQCGQPRASRHFLQGLGVGGGSNIYGMVALRGQPSDYDGWVSLGASSWGWQDVLPYFRRLERDADYGGDQLHGDDGRGIRR